jgi:DNA invertase Pin-like site-specific DNA recombinase
MRRAGCSRVYRDIASGALSERSGLEQCLEDLSEGVVDTTNPAGELIFSVFAALAQFERGLIRDRTQAGLAAARDKGRIGGRPSVSQSDQKVQLAHEMTEKGMKIKDVYLALGMSRSTYYRYLKLNDSN